VPSKKKKLLLKSSKLLLRPFINGNREALKAENHTDGSILVEAEEVATNQKVDVMGVKKPTTTTLRSAWRMANPTNNGQLVMPNTINSSLVRRASSNRLRTLLLLLMSQLKRFLSERMIKTQWLRHSRTLIQLNRRQIAHLWCQLPFLHCMNTRNRQFQLMTCYKTSMRVKTHNISLKVRLPITRVRNLRKWLLKLW